AVAQHALATLRAKLRDMTHRVDVSPETLRSAITRVEDERDKLSLDAEAMAVRRKAVEATIAKISKSAEEQMKSDRIAVELQKLVNAREAEVKRVQDLSVNKAVAQAELEAAEARLAEARVHLWERQEVVTRSA